MKCSLQFMIENWKVITEYPNYSVSDLGRVSRSRILKPRDKHGYEEVILCDAPKKPVYKTVHFLVLSTFKKNPRPTFYTMVDHINRNTKDNRLMNLRWSNARLNGLNSNARGFSFCKKSNKFHAQIMINGRGKLLGLFKYSVNARRAYLEAKREALKKLDPDQKYDV